MPFRVSVSSQSADRLASARDLVRGCRPGTRVLIVGASRGAADDLAREVAMASRATFGLDRLSLTQLAARSALVALAADGRTPSTGLGAEAVAARAVFDARQAQALRFFAPVSAMPGFPRALARTLQELRLARVDRDVLPSLRPSGPDLSELLSRFEAGFEDAASVDRAELFRMAARVVRVSPPAEVVVLLDPVLEHPVERELVEAVAQGARTTLATMPAADRDGIAALEAMGGQVEVHPPDRDDTDLGRLRTFLFGRDVPAGGRAPDGSLEFFSAPGEGRECVEIARRILREARDGVRFDEIAILVRAPRSYLGLLEHALHRAGVPAWFGRGTRRPHAAGRAFLALLACAAEHLSAARFAEYLSLGQVPAARQEEDTWARSLDEALGRPAESGVSHDPDAEAAEGEGADGSPVVAGTLRAPWRWERLLVEAAVIGRDATRWRRRLEGRRRQLDRQVLEARRDDGGEAKAEALEALRLQLGHLETFALPIVEEMAAWPDAATWGDWLDRFEALVPRTLRAPGHVLRVLGDLRPMAAIGPVGLDEARAVLGERLLTLESEPPPRRYGRVFVGTPQQARGRTFRVVFVPGLAERMFPERPREDPLLLDGARRGVDAPLPIQSQRSASERLLLQVAVGAAAERLYVSYPRIELSESRARVPSFYALDVMRAVTGEVPDHEALEERARAAGDATLAWPSPTRPEEAIDDQEHDLSVLRLLLDEPEPDAVRGHAHYLLKLNPCLRRSVVDRWARGQPRWSPGDGLTRVTPHIQAALAAHRLTAREYSISALQLFTACPYRFVLSAIYRLRPFELPEPIQHLDPLTRGSLFHEIQARLFRELAAQDALPVTAATMGRARDVLDRVADQVCTAARDELVPAVERVWDHDVAAIRRDLHAWLDYLARDGERWRPAYFELGFGQVPGERDAHSVAHAAVLDGGFRLRGAVDLVEEHLETGRLRVTDHKTGRRPDGLDRIVVGGGAVLQPVLYSLAVEATLGREVEGGRLFYCTSAGAFTEHPVPLDARTRAAGLEVLEVVDRAIEHGWLAAAPAEGACARCDFRPVCGPDVGRRVSRKPRDPLADLLALRSRP
jgi:hypothetical protein